MFENSFLKTVFCSLEKKNIFCDQNTIFQFFVLKNRKIVFLDIIIIFNDFLMIVLKNNHTILNIKINFKTYFKIGFML